MRTCILNMTFSVECSCPFEFAVCFKPWWNASYRCVCACVCGDSFICAWRTAFYCVVACVFVHGFAIFCLASVCVFAFFARVREKRKHAFWCVCA